MSFAYNFIPELTRDSLYRYVNHHVPTGSFLRAVLTNNLFEAVGRADDENLKALKFIVTYIYNEVPSNCWGSEEKVQEWLKKE